MQDAADFYGATVERAGYQEPTPTDPAALDDIVVERQGHSLGWKIADALGFHPGGLFDGLFNGGFADNSLVRLTTQLAVSYGESQLAANEANAAGTRYLANQAYTNVFRPALDYLGGTSFNTTNGLEFKATLGAIAGGEAVSAITDFDRQTMRDPQLAAFANAPRAVSRLEVALTVASVIPEIGAGARLLRAEVALAKGGGAAERVAAKYISQGFSPAQAAYLAEPYAGMGHHFIPRRVGLPTAISDSSFNVLKPSGISRGDLYELHYKVDPYFFGARFPKSVGGSWSGNSLGLQKYGSFGQIWYGSPTQLRVTVGGLGATGVGGAYYYSGDEK